MTESLLTRLFRSIEGSSQDDIVKVAYAIIEEEKKRGHNGVAARLNNILEKNVSSHSDFRKELSRVLPSGTSIPTNKRNNIPMAVEKGFEELRHEMILAPALEEKINRIEREFAAQDRLALYGLTPKKKILFYGPPGCGKSMAAERIARNVGLPFLKVRFEAVVSSYLGESASNLRNLFDAISSNPYVLLLDEFDFIGKSRTDSMDVGEMHRIVNILLHLLEEYNAPGILIATTNLESKIDKALFRRFDDVIEMAKPGEIEVEAILKKTLSSMDVSKKVDYKALAEKLLGTSAAIIVKIGQEAAKNAIICGGKTVEASHFEAALAENSVLFN